MLGHSDRTEIGGFFQSEQEPLEESNLEPPITAKRVVSDDKNPQRLE